MSGFNSPRILCAPALFAALSAMLISCGTAPTERVQGQDGRLVLERRTADMPSVAVLGVVVREGLSLGVNRTAAANDLASLVESADRRVVLSTRIARKAIGADRHSALMADFARLDSLNIRDISGSAIDRPRADLGLLIRIDEDRVDQREPLTEPVADASGVAVRDRTRLHLTTERHTVVSALLIDLNSGRERWYRSYEAVSRNDRAHTHYHGSSFSGSVAAMFANTIMNGPGAPEHPPAPGLRDNLHTLFAEVTDDLPAR